MRARHWDPLDFRLATRIVSHSDIADAVAKRFAVDQASFANKFVWPRERDDGFLALLGYDGDFDLALPDIEN